MKMKPVINKILFISLPAIIICLIVIELCLRLGGYIYTRYRHPETYSEIAASAPGTFNILCLGDSFTEGVGAGAENAYPKQLERLLKVSISKNINVINKGQGGLNSSLVVKNLQENIEKYRPAIVFIMIGGNNFWNLEESSYFSLTGQNKPFNSIINHLKIYKLIIIGWINFKSKISKEDKLISDKNGNVDGLPNSINALSFKLLTKGRLASEQGNTDLAIQKFKEAVKIDKNNCLSRFGLADRYLHLQKYRLAKKEIWKAITTDSEWNNRQLISALNCLIMRLVSQDDYKDLIRIKQYFEARYTKDKIEKLTKVLNADLCLIGQQSMLNKILEYDLKNMIELTRKNHTTIVLQTYPHAWSVNSVIEKTAYKYNIPIVGNEIIFTEKLKYNDSTKFFVTDGHCNANGYKIIAENVYNVLLKNQRFLEYIKDARL